MFSQFPIFLLLSQLIDVNSSLCIWEQLIDDAKPLFFYFGTLKTGKCSHSCHIKSKQTETSSKMQEITVLIQDLDIPAFSLVMLQCVVGRSSGINNSCLIYKYKRDQIRARMDEEQAKIQIRENEGWIYIRINKLALDEKLGKMEFYPQYLDMQVKLYENYPIFSLYTFKLLLKFVISPLIYYSILFYVQKSPFIEPYEFLQWIILLSIQSSLLTLIIQSFKHFANFDSSISLFFLISIFISNFALFGYSCHLLFENIYDGSLEMKNIELDAALIQPGILSQSQYLYPSNRIWEKLAHIYKSRTLRQRRIIRFLIVLIFYLCLPSQYPQISLILLITLLILPAAYFRLLGISSSTQFIVHDEEIRLSGWERDDILLPINKIEFVFLLEMVRFFSTLQIQQGYKFRTLTQLGTIILVNILTLYFLWAFSKEKRQKKIELLFFQSSSNLHLQKLSSSISKQKESEFEKEWFEEQCSICLQVLSEEKHCVKTQCGHLFHLACLSSWIRYRAICPIDRNRLCVGDLQDIQNQREDAIMERVSIEI